METVEIVVVGCSCGMFPLEYATHRTAREAWETAATHVKRNPDKCHPTMNRAFVRPAFAPSPTERI